MKTISGKKAGVLFGSIFLIVGLALLVLALFLRMKQIPKEDRVYTEAVITAIVTYRDSSGDRHHRAIIAYSAEGRDYERELDYFRSGFREGKKITIYYEKGNPEHIGSDGGDALQLVLLLGLGVLFAAAGGFVVYRIAFGEKLLARLVETGTKVNAVYAGTACLTNVTVNGRHPYVIRARAYDPETMQERAFDSEWFSRDPEAAVRQVNAEYFPVYLDPKHPKRYYMDVSAVKKRGAD